MKESRRITPLRTILQNCLNHIENLETNRSICDNYDKEFQNLKQFSETLKIQKEYSCTEGEKEVNRKKNRYKDILPFNISRVVLSEYAGIPGSDYINANYIKGASGSPAYIASQGPLPNTVDDFWRMVVECEVQVIVMACNAQESGKHKCENYWVEKEGEEKRFGMVRICLVKASTVCPDFLVRTMRLKYTNDKDVIEERTICQFHYSAWPDHGVPPLVRPLLDMVRLMRDTQASETLPVLVHCSAGCGRTGTICAIDFVWGLLRAGKLTEEFSLFNLVKDMRKQRVAMVQTKEQYILVHQAVRELFEEQLKVIESHPYENIDFNGVPLIKDVDEPFYETICVRNEDSYEEKQDKSEVKEKGEDNDIKINKISNAPPLPRKKRANVLFSKQEKEAENLTEKNRIFFSEKEREKTDATLSSLLGKPRIVKLRALFEKSPNIKERTAMKDRGSQTVSRSLSLGAIRKPLPAEIIESQNDKNKPSCSSSQSSQSDIAKLKHSKSFSKSVPLIKRSKSLKTFNQSSRLIVSSANDKTKKNLRNSPKVHETDSNLKNIDESFQLQSRTSNTLFQETQNLKDCSKRRRSLESLMGDIPFSITWPSTVMVKEKCASHTGKQICDCTIKSDYQIVQNYKNVDLLRQPLQHLSLETERKINNFVAGIGIRERRNSFRQAVTKNDVYNVFGNCQQCKCLNTKNSNDFFFTSNSEAHNSLNKPPQFSDYNSDTKYLELDTTSQTKTIVKKIQNVADENKLKLQKALCPLNVGPQVNKIITRDLYQQDNLSFQNNSNIIQLRASQVKTKNLRPSEDFEKNMESKNLFLKKLNSEILSEKEIGYSLPESHVRYGRSYEDSDKSTSHIVYSSAVVNSDSKKPLHKTKITITKPHNAKTDLIDETDNSSHKNIKSVEVEKTEKVIQTTKNVNFQNHHLYVQFQKPVKSLERYEKCSNAPISQSNFYHRTGHVNVDSFGHRSNAEISQVFRRNEQPKSINHSDPQHKDSYFPISHTQNVNCVSPNTLPTSLKSTDFSGNYCKNSKISDMDFYDKNKPNVSDKKFTLPTEAADKITKNFSSWSHTSACRSCEMNLSDQSLIKSESSRLLKQQEPTYFMEQDKKNIKKMKQVSELNKNYSPDFAKTMHNTESYISTRRQKKSDEMALKTNSDFSNQGNNLQQNMAKHSKDDFILEEPVAPPRIKRHASVIVPRNNLNGANNVSVWISAENKNRSNRNSTLQADETAWNDSFGIDLDAVAASLERDKKESSVLNKIKSSDNHLKMTVNAHPQKKQHYF